jgi:hypothetical protein
MTRRQRLRRVGGRFFIAAILLFGGFLLDVHGVRGDFDRVRGGVVVRAVNLSFPAASAVEDVARQTRGSRTAVTCTSA